MNSRKCDKEYSCWRRGPRAHPHVWKFGTDGVYTYGLREIPTIGIGSGDEALAHQSNEHVSVRDVEKAVEAYIAILKVLSREPDAR